MIIPQSSFWIPEILFLAEFSLLQKAQILRKVDAFTDTIFSMSVACLFSCFCFRCGLYLRVSEDVARNKHALSVNSYAILDIQVVSGIENTYIQKMQYISILLLYLCLLQAQKLQKDFPPFQEYVKQFKKHYLPQEYAQRKSNYEQKVRQLIESACEGCGVTKFSDRSPVEIKKKLDLKIPDDADINATDPTTILRVESNLRKLSAPRTLDWRKRGVVTSIKDQGECGTCWSFTTVALAESSLLLKDKVDFSFLREIDLSEQYLLKCTKYGDCNGGYLQYSIDKAILTGLPSQSDYPFDPYRTQPGICKAPGRVEISEQSRLSYYKLTDSQLMELLVSGPVAIAVSATGWEDYKWGSFSCSRYAEVNHAVLLVGYTDKQWIIKNQWGTDWGVDGYIYVTRNRNSNCGVGSAVHTLYSRHAVIVMGLSMALILFLI